MCTGVRSPVSSDRCGYIAVPGGRTNRPAAAATLSTLFLDRLK